MIPDDKKKDNKGEMVRGLSLVSQISITIIACIVIGIFLGRFLDSLFGTEPWLLIVFLFLGIGAAIKYIFDLGKNF